MQSIIIVLALFSASCFAAPSYLPSGYAAPPVAKCPTNLLVGCSPSVAPVPCVAHHPYAPAPYRPAPPPAYGPPPPPAYAPPPSPPSYGPPPPAPVYGPPPPAYGSPPPAYAPPPPPPAYKAPAPAAY